MAKQQDDLSAVRDIAALLEGFSNEERERIIRWVREKLGMSGPATVSTLQHAPANPGAQGGLVSPANPANPAPPARDIRSFVAEKEPKSVSQLIAVIAYYHRFVATGDAQKDTIDVSTLVDGCRKSGKAIPKRPDQAMVNAFHDGLVDRLERGQYKISTVGENLVTMVLPDGEESGSARRVVKAKGARAKKAPARKK
jgi:hypothetical protein